MNKIILQTLTSIVLITTSAYANDFGSSGKFIIKGKLQGFMPSLKSSTTNSSSKFYPIKTNNQTYPVTAVTSAGNVLGIAASAAYFLTDNLAVEVSTGFISQKIKVAGTGPQFNYYNNTYDANGAFHQATKAGFIPFAAAVQYHIAPYGKISPYLGAGYHYTFATASSGSTVDASRGVTFQAGVDGWINDNLLFNLEVKKMMMNPKITFKNPFALGSNGNPTSQNLPTSTRIKLDPLTLSAGLGIRL